MSEMSQFVDRFTEVAADSDYSSYARLTGIDRWDIRATAEALWTHWLRFGGDREEMARSLTGEVVIDALLAQEARYDDEGDLVEAQFTAFWDAVDDMKLTFGLRGKIRSELASKYLGDQREQGHSVVSDGQGIWLFKFDDSMDRIHSLT
ncbi:hypothetical protein [Streptomyces cucumeris]|uniref:hypothetical protein n=1 Tax=Streptomyces cucumeris TaxID=2962890 RepID=UPI0020C91717|nr:hypothetical protein [Streptomyces sp. NEAU-Y11]MCP9209602.1 hypothetical protein [Streptomyces sp. NEAU-Y11]